MIPTFNKLDLFNSGPSMLTPGPIELRSALTDPPHGVGTTLLSQGTRVRRLEQRGQLHADDAVSLYELIDTIEDQIDGLAHTLTDEHGRDWPHCVMTRFNPGDITRRGPRVSVSYTIHYTQVLP